MIRLQKVYDVDNDEISAIHAFLFKFTKLFR